jgi:hypothetical protein
MLCVLEIMNAWEDQDQVLSRSRDRRCERFSVPPMRTTSVLVHGTFPEHAVAFESHVIFSGFHDRVFAKRVEFLKCSVRLRASQQERSRQATEERSGGRAEK